MAQKKAVKKTTTKKKEKKEIDKKTTENKEEITIKNDKYSSIIDGQPVVNIGLVGHVDHGKTTLTERFSGKWTDTHSEELKRGITIRLGYADTVFYKCQKCPEPTGYSTTNKCSRCGGEAIPLRKVSFIDAPGHESLMATMIAGSAIMDGALLLVAANEDCPQPQTMEHLMTLEIIGIKKIIIIQNKIDLVTEEQAIANYKSIKSFLKNTKYENNPIIPISAKLNVNIDLLINAIENHIITPKRNEKQDPIMFVARSFDINKPGSDPEKVLGGVLGGSIKQGIMKINDEIEIRPGRLTSEKNQEIWKPIFTKITGLKTGGKDVKSLLPGGSVAIMTSLDPALVKSDSLTGSVVGLKNKIPPVFHKLKMKLHLLERIVGLKENNTVETIKDKEVLMLNVNSAATVGVVSQLSKEEIVCILKRPVCCEIGSRITISRRIGNRFRLIGYGILKE
jgi:translation initiation factor 2 subunit 3